MLSRLMLALLSMAYCSYIIRDVRRHRRIPINLSHSKITQRRNNNKLYEHQTK